jgi:hypothetical protein
VTLDKQEDKREETIQKERRITQLEKILGGV